MQLPKSILYSIISNNHLTIESEDSLLDFISSLFDENKNEEEEIKEFIDNDDLSIIMFYEKVQFCMLTEWTFINFLNDFDFNDMTNELWRNFIKCFHMNYRNSIDEQDKERYKMTFDYDGKKEHCLKGIINYINKDYNNNFEYSPMNIYISSSTDYGNTLFCNQIDDNNHNPLNIVDYFNDEKYFETKNSKNSWIMFNFNDKYVRPTYYTIKSPPSSSNNPKNWCIEGSNSGEEKDWMILDLRENISIFKGDNMTFTFKISLNQNDNYYKFLRIRQTGQNMNYNNILSISALEFFGDVSFYNF